MTITCSFCGKDLSKASAYTRNFTDDTRRCEDCEPPAARPAASETIRRKPAQLEWVAAPPHRSAYK